MHLCFLIAFWTSLEKLFWILCWAIYVSPFLWVSYCKFTVFLSWCHFLWFLNFLSPCIVTYVFDKAVTSDFMDWFLWWKTFTCMLEHAGASSDPRFSGAHHQVQFGVLWLWVWDVCNILLGQAAVIHSINNSVVLGKHCQGSAVAASVFVILNFAPSLVARTRVGSGCQNSGVHILICGCQL